MTHDEAKAAAKMTSRGRQALQRRTRERDAKLEQILIAADITNEAGHQVADFCLRNRDAEDFASVSRSTLHNLLAAAYAAGAAK